MDTLKNYPAYLSTPIIERLYDLGESFGDANLDRQIQQHNNLAHKICQLLEDPKTISKKSYDDYLESLTIFLKEPFSKRILLYLPFSTLKDTPQDFHEVYHTTLYDLFSEVDIRENFHEGDVFEPNARRYGKVDLIVKVAHLLPWIIEAGYFNFPELEWLIKDAHDDELLLQSLRDTWSVLKDKQLISTAELQQLQAITNHIPPRTNATPLYNSLQRQNWLARREDMSYKLLTPNANLAGPFSCNLQELLPTLRLAMSQNPLNETDIALFNGSRLHGYGIVGSDIDCYKLDELERHPANLPGSANHAYLVLTSVWLGGDQVANLATIAKQVASQYFANTTNRKKLLYRLETGLLQYRLLHKGYRRFYQINKFDTAEYYSIDGDCAFYNDGYRKVATQLFAKYVFLPTTI